MRPLGAVYIFLAVIMLLSIFLVSSCGEDDDDDSGSSDDDDNSDDDVADDDDDSSDDDDDNDDDTTPVYADEFTVVEMVPETPATVQLAVQACAGLYNRELGGSIYTHMTEKDSRWLEELDLEPEETTDSANFLVKCVAEFPCVRYSYSAQQKLLPNILTVGTVLGAVPLDEGMTVTCDNPAFDATVEFEERDTPYLATKYVYETYVDDTTGLAMLNPGYATHDSPVWNPTLDRDPRTTLVDFVFSKKLFVVFLINGCIESTPDGALFSEIATANPWPSPIGVYGYNNSWLVFGGYFFEAQTRCLDSRNMGAIPTETSNLSFFSSRRGPIVEANEIEQNELEDIDYDPNMTYVAFVVGDGDNIAYIMDARSEWLRQRLEDCEQPVNSCEPITWSISPHLPYIAPDVLEWYYDKSHETGKDYFMLPPSGHLYAYPASMGDAIQDQFVAATEQDARILDTNSTIHWDWATTWQRAETQFLPKYAKQGGDIRGIFPVNVPYMFPTFTWWNPNQFFKLLIGDDGGEVVLFRPREWRGIDDSGSGITEPFYLSPANMAEELANYPLGTVSYVYMTSDGGLNLENSFMAMVELLPAHVRLVSGDTAVRLALASISK
jgi:GxGYxYP putative glycoside hydrolase C-terminal domain